MKRCLSYKYWGGIRNCLQVVGLPPRGGGGGWG